MKIKAGESYEVNVERIVRGKSVIVKRKARVTDVFKKGRGHTIEYVVAGDTFTAPRRLFEFMIDAA